MEYWNVGLKGMLFTSLIPAKRIYTITQFSISSKPITPLFHYSNIPIVSEVN